MTEAVAECQVSPLTVRRYHTCGYFQEKTLQLVSEIGLKNQETTYLVTCEHTMPNEFLEILNEIITNNSVSYLVNDHKETGIDEKVKKQTLKPISDQDEISSARSEESLDNLHVVLCISPVHDQFKKNCTVYPGIIRSSYIDWIFPWSKQALKAVATTLLKDVEVLPEAEKPNIIDSIVHVHHSTSQRIDNYFQTNGIRCYLGPTHFLKFISDYLNSINMNRRKMTLKTLQLTQVQKKLDESNFLLEALNQKLAEKKKLISEKLAAIDQLSDGIAEAEELLNAKGDELKETALQASTVRKMMYEQEAQIEDLMNKANPQLYSGWRALSELDQETVSAMCSSLVIPEPVQVVCECVAILRGAANLEWTTVREYMEDPFVLTKLREMDHTAVTDETQQRIKTRLRSSRRIGEMEQISTGGYGILKYLEHILQFCHIYKDVKPMQVRAKDYEKQWHKLTADVDSTNEAISSLEKKLAGMKAELKDGGSKQEKMMEETRKMDLELEVANSLFASLNEDSKSWKRDLRKMQYEIENVYGDCLLSTAFLNYASVFDQENRHQIIYGDWRMCLRSKSVRVTDYYNVENHLSEDLSITRWLAEGLPKESHAVQNVILIKQSQKCPILIDPDKQMRKWIMVHEKENGVQSLSTHDSKFDEKLIVALKNGKPVVLCEFKYLNELLLCVLQPKFMEDGSMIVQIGSEQIPCNPNFRLYIIISCFQDTLDPTVYTSATIIDCTLGEAIEEKSSQIAMTCFDPAIGAEQRELQLHRFRISGNLRSLQEITLQKLHEYQGNIFDDFLFIQELTKLRNESEHLVSRMDQEAAQLDAIDAQRRSHSSIAKRTAVMFRSFNNMKKLSPANRTSFETFSLVLEKILVQLNTELHANPLERLTKDLFSFQSAGLSNKDKLVYGLLLAAELKIEARQLTASKFEAFVNGWRTRAATDAPPHDWISNTQWGMVESLAISFPSQFESMIDDISANGEEWKKWLQGKRENAWTLPGAIDQNFDSSFDKLLVIKSLRKDALLYSIQYFIKEVLGEVFLTPSTLRFEDIMHVTTCETPILVSVGRGSDPLPELLALNKKIHQNPICDHISLGRGSEKLVLEKVSQSIQQGTWLIIQNCHVIPSFMYELHQTFCSFEHKNSTFRLWMTTEDVSVFLLQFVLSSHKIVIEEPTPVKISLLDTYESLDPEQFSSCVHPAFRSTVFALAFFHGVIEERKKFGKYGWSMDYNFTKTDLLVSITIIKQYLDKIFNEGNFRIPWDSLRYFIGEVVYGGRVTDDHDRRILNTYIHEYFGDFILESTKPFEFNRMGTICQYPLPPFGERQDYIDYIRSLPLLTEPSVFGVHDKRQHDVEIDEAEDVCQKLAIISNRLIGDSEFNSLGRQNDEILTIISSIESKIPDTFQYEKLKMSIGSDPQPMMLCLIRELKTFNQLIATMKSSLDGVRKVVTGLSVTTNEISEVRDQLMSHSPPRLWTKFVPECDQNVGKWLLTLGRRSNQFEKWVTRGEPWILWLAGLAYPQAYLTAIAQVACREEGWPMDAVAFHTEVTEYQKRSAIPSKPKTGLYVEGLFLDGAQWDFAEKCLQTLTGDTSIYPLPIIGLFTSPARGLPIQGCLKLPVYATPKRKKSENGKVITELNIPTKKHESFWILENVYIKFTYQNVEVLPVAYEQLVSEMAGSTISKLSGLIDESQ